MKLANLIVCEDVRDEKSNKFSLMGIFNDKIKLQGAAPPTADQIIQVPMLCVFARSVLEPGDFEAKHLRFRALIDDAVQIEYEGPAPEAEGSSLTFKIRMPGFQLKLGKLIFEITYLDESKSKHTTLCSDPIQVLFEQAAN